MAKRRVVYAVERGEYSDYGIVAIFATRKAAKAAIAQITDKYGDERVVEWLVHEEIPPKLSWLVIQRGRDGEVSEWINVTEGWDNYQPFVGRVRGGVGIGLYDGTFRRVWGTDHAKVRKVWAEIDGQKLAEAAGIA